MLMENQVVPHEAHKYAFHVSGPRNLASLTWRDIFSSRWKDANYRRTAIACCTRAVYALEVDRQESRRQENALAPEWLIPFKYKLTRILIDERDGSIFGAVFEWDRSAAWADSVPIRLSGAPRAIVALRGTLLKSPTMRRDIEDDLRFLALESLKCSARFNIAMEALKSVCDAYGSRNVCIAGHSLGAGFALQLGKELSEEGICVETHLFNPPSVSLAMSLGDIGENAEYVWKRLKSMFVSSSKDQVRNVAENIASVQLKSLIPCLSGLMDSAFRVDKWVPHLYVNNNDYICCFYNPNDGTGEKISDGDNISLKNGEVAANLYVVYKENQKFHEAHGLEQWWSSDAHSSKLIRRELRSLNTGSLMQVTRLIYPPSFSLAMNLQAIGVTTNFVWIRLSSLLPSSIKAQVSNYGENALVVWLKSCWIPRLSGLKDACFWVQKWVPYLYFWSSYTNPDGTGEKIANKENMVPSNRQIAAKLLSISKEKQKFLVARGLEQWWPNDVGVWQAIHNSKPLSGELRSLYTVTPWEVAHLFNPSSVSLTMSLSNIRENAEFVCKWNSIRSMLCSSGESQVRNDADRSWMALVSGLKDACFVFGKWVPFLYSKIIDYISRKLGSLCPFKPSQVMHLFNLPSFSPAMSLRSTGEKAEFVWNRLKSMFPSGSKAQVSDYADKTSSVFWRSWILLLSGLKSAVFGVSKWVLHLYVNNEDGLGEKMVCKENTVPTNVQIAAALLVISKEKLKFLEAHGLEHWFSSDSELQHAAIHNSKPIIWQLRSLYTGIPWEVADLFNSSSISFAKILSNIGEREECVCKWNSIKSTLSSSGEARVGNDADKTSDVSLKSWIPLLSGLKDAGSRVAKRVTHLYDNKMVDKENIDPSNEQIAAKLFAESKEKLKSLEARGLKHWFSSDAELQHVMHIRKLISPQLTSLYRSTPWQVTHLFNPPSISMAKSLIKIHGLEQCWSNDAVIQQAIHHSKIISSQLRYVYNGKSFQATHGKPW